MGNGLGVFMAVVAMAFVMTDEANATRINLALVSQNHLLTGPKALGIISQRAVRREPHRQGRHGGLGRFLDAQVVVEHSCCLPGLHLPWRPGRQLLLFGP